MFNYLSQVFLRERLAGTLLPSAVLAGALTVLPAAVLTFQGRATIAAPMAIIQLGFAGALLSTVLTVVASRWLAPHVAGIVFGVFGYAFFSLSWAKGDSILLLTCTWITVGLAMSAVVIWLVGDSHLFVNLAAGATLLAGVALGALSVGGASPTGDGMPTALSFDSRAVRTPNVYLFVMDAFGRPDVLQDTLGDVGFNIEDPLRRFEQLGFVNEENASANYIETNLSIPSTLNGLLHHTPENPMSHNDHWSYAVSALAGNNATVSTLRRAGYEYWHSGSGIWDHASCDATVADLCLGAGVTAFESRTAIWNQTPLRRLFQNYGEGHRQDPLKVADQILNQRNKRETDDPYFVFAHFLLPHSPYTLTRECEPAPQNSSSLFHGSEAEHRRLYSDQTICVTEQLLVALERIIAEDPDAIIFVQGDHGPAFSVDLDAERWSPEAITERLSPLRLTRLPTECRSNDTAAQSLVNTLPLLAACIFGTEPNLVEPAAYTSAYKAQVPPSEVEITLITG